MYDHGPPPWEMKYTGSDSVHRDRSVRSAAHEARGSNESAAIGMASMLAAHSALKQQAATDAVIGFDPTSARDRFAVDELDAALRARQYTRDPPRQSFATGSAASTAGVSILFRQADMPSDARTCLDMKTEGFGFGHRRRASTGFR